MVSTAVGRATRMRCALGTCAMCTRRAVRSRARRRGRWTRESERRGLGKSARDADAGARAATTRDVFSTLLGMEWLNGYNSS